MHVFLEDTPRIKRWSAVGDAPSISVDGA